MEMCKMAELRYEAPLATFDLDEWNEFLDGGDGDLDDTSSAAARHPGTAGGGGSMADGGGGTVLLGRRAGDGDEEEDEAFSGSLEDLVSTFDDKIIKCFRNFAEQAEIIAPVQVRSQEDLNRDSQTWWTLTGNYGGILPIDWSQLYPQNQTDNQNNNETYKDTKLYGSECQSEKDDGDYDDDDDDETDMDQDDSERTTEENIYVAPQNEEEEPVATADEVISEIEGMLDDFSSDTNSTNARNGLISQRRKLEHVVTKFADKELQTFTLSCLYEVRDELNESVRDLSEILVDELAVRDDLDYEKELKNQFIWLLPNVQKRRREVLLEMSYRQKSKVIGNGYLTTVIPYQASQDPLAIEKLQIYIKILSAINEDHCSVPALLTDYILRVLCPTT